MVWDLVFGRDLIEGKEGQAALLHAGRAHQNLCSGGGF